MWIKTILCKNIPCLLQTTTVPCLVHSVSILMSNDGTLLLVNKESQNLLKNHLKTPRGTHKLDWSPRQ